MFKNRAAQIKFVKTSEPTNVDRRPLINEAEAKVLKSVGKAMAMYVVSSAVAIKITAAVCDHLTK